MPNPLLFQIAFLRVTLIDLVDVAIVAYVLYRLYGVMRGTIAGQIFIGLLLIAAVSFVSQTLNMKLLSWLLKTVSDFWVIALIILFQPELRRILLMLGRNGLFTTYPRYDVNQAVDELLSASEDLSLRRFGALIVITRSTDLSLTFDTGVPLDSRLSKEMLVSIFNPKSPLHDGAVVVSGEQIRSARVILPLSAATRIADVHLGTRHRAGLGISEQADVFVIIISEETGSISFANEGTLYYNQSLDALRLSLLQALEVMLNRKDRRTVRAMSTRLGPEKDRVAAERRPKRSKPAA
ncbi:MAG: TIGR00159 family protein [Bacteroidetes bacterium]|nr:TIGR00159 family protein [Bacteroidota bacterium]